MSKIQKNTKYCLEEAPFKLNQKDQAFLEGYCGKIYGRYLIPKTIINLLYTFVYLLVCWNINFVSVPTKKTVFYKIFKFDLFEFKARFKEGKLGFYVMKKPIGISSAVFRLRFVFPGYHVSEEISLQYNARRDIFPIIFIAIRSQYLQSIFSGEITKIKLFWNFELIDIKYHNCNYHCYRSTNMNFHKSIKFANVLNFRCDLSAILQYDISHRSLIFKQYLDNENWALKIFGGKSPLKFDIKFCLLQFPSYVKRFTFRMKYKIIVNGQDKNSRSDYKLMVKNVMHIPYGKLRLLLSNEDLIKGTIILTGKIQIVEVTYFDNIVIKHKNMLGKWL